MHNEFQRQLNRIAETHFYLRPKLVEALRHQRITEDARAVIGDYTTYADYWAATYSDRFFDMGTFIRLGSAIESCLKWFYMFTKGYTNIPQLTADSGFRPNIFQRVHAWHKEDGVLALYRRELGVDLTEYPSLIAIQEAMLHRHLYAHGSGLVDAKYLERIQLVTGNDLRRDPTIASSFPDCDTYWFEPLTRLPEFIQHARTFFARFPESHDRRAR